MDTWWRKSFILLENFLKVPKVLFGALFSDIQSALPDFVGRLLSLEVVLCFLF